ncbi:MAG: type II toxin-antitoxin system VapC family toxin [Gammaproteobacteria bacterium]|nr:type II toxin-antitoxin system VapC family toxin [Gammaproteobacteria bacterium]MYD00716.1 type II toxin-antitoxin system VapC family toxin [Gammaproteobacteria bacterium]MYI25496.1 type II toxin-antitoxin system VapC family toxin [Gammaproteobacteria bacterium]
MKLVDVNVLLYSVNEEAHQHAAVRRWWEHALSGDESIGLPWLVLSGFLRLATHPRVFPEPLPVDTALEKVDAWLSARPAAVITEKPGHWLVLLRLLSESGTAGSLTTDAHLAALAITHDASLVSCDGDFARFDGLRWENPLSGCVNR